MVAAATPETIRNVLFVKLAQIAGFKTNSKSVGAMFSHVYEMGILTSVTSASPFVVCYMCSYMDETDRKVFTWVIDDVLRISSPWLHTRAVQNGFSELANCERAHVPPIPLPSCHWIELQKRAVIILSMLESV